MASIDVGERIWFQVPTPDGRIDVVVPGDMSPAEARHAAEKVAAVIEAMFMVRDLRTPFGPTHRQAGT